ncbi:MAG: asparagine--tRNA ligase [Bacteroidales bacterium]
MKRTEIKKALEMEPGDEKIVVKGWVRNKRSSKNVAFITLNDGSVLSSLQVVAEVEKTGQELLSRIHTGAALCVKGVLQESKGAGQKLELIAGDIEIYGEADPEKYPLQPKKHSMEFLREIAHLRFRTNTFSAVNRLRHTMIFAVHKYFHERGFYNIHTPIITASDAEGAGETFHVTTLDIKDPPKNNDGTVDYTQDFFGRETNLTVSGQLEAELAALALSKVYTFGPTFRAENSNTKRHLAEFWMIEPEVAFNDLNDNMNLAEDFLKFLVRFALDNCREDLDFLDKRQEDMQRSLPKEQRSPMRLAEKLMFILDNEFERISYSRAIEILQNSRPNKKKKFDYIIEGWGADLQSEHERFLVEKHFEKPVIITDYPRQIKAFYMKQNEDETVRAMDILFPEIGEIVGGSQREEQYDKLQKRMQEMNIPEQELWWFMDTRKFGTVPHSGFGLGFERFMLFITGMGNIRDVIPFPRTPQNAEF